MKDELLSKYDRAVPRYTSYPTAPHFHTEIGEDDYRQWLNALDPDKSLSLYLHVPFCAEMCWYCGCNTKVTHQYKPVSSYAQTLCKELDLLADALPERFSVSHIHWGGGTPTMLSAKNMAEISTAITNRFDIGNDAEIAVEIDPRTAGSEKIRMLAQCNVNRVSLGIQDFSPHVQKAINRVQSYDMTATVVHDLRDNGITRINFDLMYGLPLQTEADIERTVDLSLALRPDRIALFGYAHVPWMKSHMKMIHDCDLPNGEERLKQAEAASKRLRKAGYIQIGLDHFAHPEDEMALAATDGNLNRNFQGYTTDDATTLLGIGASAIGRLPQGYVQNTVPTGGYEEAIAAGRLPIAKGVATNLDDQVRRQVIERLMCDMKVDLDDVLKASDLATDYFASELQELQEMAEDGVVNINGNKIRMNDDCRLLVRNACAVFDTYFETGLQRHSRSV